MMKRTKLVNFYLIKKKTFISDKAIRTSKLITLGRAIELGLSYWFESNRVLDNPTRVSSRVEFWNKDWKSSRIEK